MYSTSPDGTRFLFTSESVGEGHPDKLCDIISDSVLDAFLTLDPNSQVACECVAKTGMVMVFGEVRSTAKIDYFKLVRQTIKDVGYDSAEKGLGYDTCNVQLVIEDQSPEIHSGVFHEDTKDDAFEDIGAGDQGLMFGYATDETDNCMPLTTNLAHNLLIEIADMRRSGKHNWIRPDCKSQVTVEYECRQGAVIPLWVHSVVLSVQHSPEVDLEFMRGQLKEVVMKVVPPKYIKKDMILYLQPSGCFTIGGPQADAGLTGRKIIVDTYGGWGSHGGGAMSGKDSSKVDRSGAYAARWVAKSLVKSGLCKRVLVQISYAIGVAEPTSLSLFTYGTGVMSESKLVELVKQNFDLRPGAIIKQLNLREPVFKRTACYGHFGYPEYTWEIPKHIFLEN